MFLNPILGLSAVHNIIANYLLHKNDQLECVFSNSAFMAMQIWVGVCFSYLS